ncbi:glycosyltransferase family 4 protein [Alphaproteobacteria bacterium]|nr:glycosyltransferase family 4 protein [Alphaproteobacteria bacterium]
MHIWIFQTGEPIHTDNGGLRPMRAMNLADTLVSRGHTVTLWTASFFHQEKRHRSNKYLNHKVNNFLEIRLIPSRGYQSNIGLGRLIDHAQLALNLKSALKNIETVPDVAFIGYPPIEFAYVASSWLKKNKVPFMLDCKDLWPQIFLDIFPVKLRKLVKIVFFPYFYLGRKSMQNATALCGISQSFLNWMSVFSNRVLSELDCVLPLSPLNYKTTDEDPKELYEFWEKYDVRNDGRIRFFYAGSHTRALDFEPIAFIARKADFEGYDWQFVVCGDGPERENIEKLFSNLKNVIFTGWINRYQIDVLAKLSTIGLIPYQNTQDFVWSIPNKAIDYLCLGKPILTSLNGEVRRLVTENNCGLVYSPEQLDTLFHDLKHIVSDETILSDQSKNARALFLHAFLGEKIYQQLVERLESLASESV